MVNGTALRILRTNIKSIVNRTHEILNLAECAEIGKCPAVFDKIAKCRKKNKPEERSINLKVKLIFTDIVSPHKNVSKIKHFFECGFRKENVTNTKRMRCTDEVASN
jgi:hypothetical protein